MKITQKAINSFNYRKDPSFNESWNKANGIHSMAEHALLYIVMWADSGMLRKPISLKKVRDYLKLNPSVLDEIKKRYKLE